MPACSPLLTSFTAPTGCAGSDEQASSMAEDSLVGRPIPGCDDRMPRLEFTGTAAELLDELTRTDLERPPHGWPKSARDVTGS